MLTWISNLTDLFMQAYMHAILSIYYYLLLSDLSIK